MSIAYALTWLMVVRGGLYSAGRRSERSVLLSRLTLLCAVRHLRVWKMNLGPNPQASLLAVRAACYWITAVCTCVVCMALNCARPLQWRAPLRRGTFGLLCRALATGGYISFRFTCSVTLVSVGSSSCRRASGDKLTTESGESFTRSPPARADTR